MRWFPRTTLLWLPWVFGCVLPESTTPIEVRGTSIAPASSLFAVTDRVVDQFFAGTVTLTFAEVILSDVACDEVPTECGVPVSGAPRVTVSVELKESLFGQTTLGDHEIPSEGSWDAQLDEEVSVFAQTGKLNLLAIDEERLVMTYDVAVTGDERVVGDIVAQQCDAFGERFTCQ